MKIITGKKRNLISIDKNNDGLYIEKKPKQNRDRGAFKKSICAAWQPGAGKGLNAEGFFQANGKIPGAGDNIFCTVADVVLRRAVIIA